MKILVVDPIVKTEFMKDIDNIYSSLKIKGAALDFESLKEGPLSIETEEDEKSAVPDLLRVIKEGEEKGYDAIIINCFGNPGLEEARKLVKISVIGAGEASFLKIKEMERGFSVLTTVEEAVIRVKRNARKCGVERFLLSVKPLGMHVLELGQRERLRKALVLKGGKAVQEDHAEVIVLGCTGMVGNAGWLSRKLGAPVIDPARAAFETTIKVLTELQGARAFV
ncbi:MAG: aspartate/glutamate racemase family protein [Candidatus Bathyarchaeota archaeon]|nr:aspartate/glutamate racemase family protein [Candidatus Bathyarchaeota archaeon]MDH5732730.1 aspartate/glutamate racemase family protein [Candidatus Bathyarchaeota archaeon]